MKIIREQITLQELKQLAKTKFGDMVKCVADIERKIMAVDANLHADEETLLLEDGSKQENLWGFNIYPELPKEQWIEFDSMINLKPAQGNRSRSVENPAIQAQIAEIANKLVKA